METFNDMQWDVESVELRLQELRIDSQTLLLSFLDVLEHAK